MTATVRRALRCISTIFISMLILSVAHRSEAFAQRLLRDVNGIVSDQHQVPLKGAVVQVRNLDTEEVISYITGVDGRYSFKRLEGNTDYSIWAKVHGRRSKAKDLSIFDSSKPKTINFVIGFK